MRPHRRRPVATASHARLRGMVVRTSVGLAVSTLALAGCGDSTSDDVPTSVPASVPVESVDGRTYLSTATAGFDLVEGTTVRLSFTDGQVGLSAGCNSIGGAFSIDGAALVVSAVSMTEMGCDAPLMAQDQTLVELLSERPTLVVEGDVLVVEGSSRSITFLDRRVADPDQPLELTTWTLTGVITGDAASSVPADAVATLSISDGTALVSTGCNTGSAPVTVVDATVTFGPLALTKMACSEPLMQLEAQIVAVLSGETTVSIEASTLTVLHGADGLTYGIVAG